jgi:hypothetical protein
MSVFDVSEMVQRVRFILSFKTVKAILNVFGIPKSPFLANTHSFSTSTRDHEFNRKH